MTDKKETEQYLLNIEQYLFNQDTKTLDKRNTEFFSLIRQMLVLSTTLLGLLIALHKYESNRLLDNILLICTIALLGLNILIALTILHEKVRNLDRLRKRMDKVKKQVMAGKLPPPREIFEPFGGFFDKLTKVFYASFALSVVCLVLYGSFALTAKKENKDQKPLKESAKQCSEYVSKIQANTLLV